MESIGISTSAIIKRKKGKAPAQKKRKSARLGGNSIVNKEKNSLDFCLLLPGEGAEKKKCFAISAREKKKPAHSVGPKAKGEGNE